MNLKLTNINKNEKVPMLSHTAISANIMSKENFVYDYKKRIDDRCSEDWFRTDEQIDYFENE
jgi:hypothetical protein